MGVYSKALRHVDSKDFRKTHQRLFDEQKSLCKIEREQKLQERKEIEKIKKLSLPFKSDWRSELFVEEEYIGEVEQTRINVKVPERLKSNWRKELNEAMSSKDFEYLYGMSISSIQIGSVLNNVQSTTAQDILQASSNFVSYQFGNDFPGSFITSVGDNQVTSQSKVDVVAFLDTSYGNVSGTEQSYRLTTGPEGLPPEGQSPPGSVVSKVNLETALGITLPSGVPNGALNGTPIEGSAIKRIFTNATPGRRINFNWTFASSEDFLGAATVDDYAFVAIKGSVTKFVSVLTRGLQYGGQFVYTVQPEDIVDGKVEVGIGVIDVFDPYVQTSLNISNFGSFWGAGTLGDTTDAADLGMSVAAGTPQSQQKKKKSEEPFKLPGGGTLTKGSDTGFTPQTTFTYDKVTDSGVQKVTTTIPKSASSSTILKSFNQYTQGKSPSFAVGFIEGMDSAKRNEVLNSLGPKATATFNQIQQYKELNKKLSQSRNPADWDRAVQVSGSIQQLYDKFGKEMKGETVKSQLSEPKPQTSLTPEKLANIEASLKQLEIDKQKDKDEANKRNWELAANLGMDALTVAALLSPIPGDEAVAIGARTAAQTRTLARNFSRQNPGKYNPFLSDKTNALARQQGVGTNVSGQNPAFRQPIKNSYDPQGNNIMERKTLKTVQQALYPGQPSPKGFPDAPPPEMLNGYHPDFGKKDNMYNTLDKVSADSMPLTGDSKIDAKIKKAREQPK